MYPKCKVSGAPAIPVMFVCLREYLSDGYYIWGQITTGEAGAPAFPFSNSKLIKGT